VGGMGGVRGGVGGGEGVGEREEVQKSVD